MRVIATTDAPDAIGPYEQGVIAGGLVYCSGQLGLDPASGGLVPGGIETETRRALANLEGVLRAAGCGLADVVRTTVYLVDLAEFAAMNQVYGEVFRAPFPARATVGVAALPRGGRIEIDAIALYKGDLER